MDAKADVLVRWATEDDLSWCQATDHPNLPEGLLAYKIRQREILLAEVEGQRVGYLRLENLWGTVPYIALIWVLPEYRGRGVGKALVAYLVAHLRAQGHEALYSSSQANEPGPQAWHRHVGFVECGFIAGINEGGIGEVFFRKALS